MGNLSRAVIEGAFSRHHHDKIGNYSDVEQQEYDLCRALIDFQQYSEVLITMVKYSAQVLASSAELYASRRAKVPGSPQIERNEKNQT